MPGDPERDPEAHTQAGEFRRKPYVAPAVRVYGKASELTLMIGNTSHKSDGGSMAASKTA